MSQKSTSASALVPIIPDNLKPSRRPLCAETYAALRAEAPPIVLTCDRLLTAEAMRLLIRLNRELTETRVRWNQDRFRRVIHARSKAAARLRRRWANLTPPPAIPLGHLGRR
ncbi:MAG: hypothetical protein QOJ64_2300 [Acidobacteriota bacterium]|jgi:hypothetical protein|nr:hypothetical protein [Acidobacteriota bacterium]